MSPDDSEDEEEHDNVNYYETEKDRSVVKYHISTWFQFLEILTT